MQLWTGWSTRKNSPSVGERGRGKEEKREEEKGRWAGCRLQTGVQSTEYRYHCEPSATQAGQGYPAAR